MPPADAQRRATSPEVANAEAMGKSSHATADYFASALI